MQKHKTQIAPLRFLCVTALLGLAVQGQSTK